MKVDPESGEVQMAWRDRRAIVLNRAAYVCEECHEAPATEVDHIWPRSWGGQDDLDNLRATCLPCNRTKGGSAYVKDLTWTRALWAEQRRGEEASAALYTAAMFCEAQALIAAGMSGPEAYDLVSERGASDEYVAEVAAWVLGDRFTVATRGVDEPPPDAPPTGEALDALRPAA